MRKTTSLLATTLAFTLLAACNGGGTSTTPPPTTPSSAMASSSKPTSTTGVSTWTWDGKLVSGKHEVVLKTSKGDINIELDATIAPKTVTNFMALAASGYYNNLTFHRVIPDFMIQGGDPTGTGRGGQSIFGDTFEDEINESSATYTKIGYKAGTIAMANRGPDTNSSQFFIMDKDYPLSPNYTIFGHVTSGQGVVNAIARVPRDNNDMPTEKVTFEVKIIK